MSDFDQFDQELADALQKRTGVGAGSVASAHDAVLARAGHIRRRRAATTGGVAMIALLIGGIALLPRGGADTLAPADTGDVLPSVVAEVDNSTETPPTDEIDDATAPVVTSVDDDFGTSPTIDDGPATTDPTATNSTIPGVAPASSTKPSTAATTVESAGATATTTASTAGSSSATNTTESTTSSTDTSSSTSEVAAPPINPFTKTYNSTGGSITVNWNGSALSLVSVAPKPGFESEIEDDQPLRIRVRFRSDDASSRIEIRVSGGELIETIS